MKQAIVVVLVVLLGTVFLSADLYIKAERYRNETKDGVHDLWLGKDRAAFITPEEIYIYNKKLKKVWMAAPKQKTYVVADVPLDMSKLLSPETAARMSQYKIRGTVKRTDKTRTILNKKCVGYEMDQWVDLAGKKVNESKTMIWVYEDIGPGFAIFNELMDIIRQKTNRDEAFRQELLKIKGAQLLLEIVQAYHGETINYRIEVKEISEKDPPAGVYEIPKDFAKKEKL
ncbi:MAG: hypothetical protein GTO45_16030 [Candidatus Aminicenantes bacterium]|nr:hypothetical protein [Candidatus Aminicenantes bacterium]NIM80287.1 hypothetical protein [Candidatus Aminicenantes bacterium]NIN19634.1 hypothetical protein [Candidatus Aminicenantes bacterium]NIN43516.1 hypothetical protein [Candidatus Aminicenantes bacterium]NIN86261.1 hypothetical protein [Candidatus Aminicenantes bacterium]